MPTQAFTSAETSHFQPAQTYTHQNLTLHFRNLNFTIDSLKDLLTTYQKYVQNSEDRIRTLLSPPLQNNPGKTEDITREVERVKDLSRKASSIEALLLFFEKSGGSVGMDSGMSLEVLSRDYDRIREIFLKINEVLADLGVVNEEEEFADEDVDEEHVDEEHLGEGDSAEKDSVERV